MNWMKVAAVVVGGVVVFFVVNSLIHIFLGILTALAFVAVVAGGIYAAVKISEARKRRQVRRRPARHEDRELFSERPVETAPAPRPSATPRPAASHHDVEDDLARLKREMGS